MKNPSFNLLVAFGKESYDAIVTLAKGSEMSSAAVVRILVRHALRKNPTISVVYEPVDYTGQQKARFDYIPGGPFTNPPIPRPLTQQASGGSHGAAITDPGHQG